MIHPSFSEPCSLTSSAENFLIAMALQQLTPEFVFILLAWTYGVHLLETAILLGSHIGILGPQIGISTKPPHLKFSRGDQIINASTNKAHHHHNHSKMPGVVINNPQNTIRTIFSESQKSAATHRKLVNSLRTVQLTCIQQNNEQTFNEVFIKCLNRVLPVKKSEPTADRVVKFIGHFIQHVQDKGNLAVGVADNSRKGRRRGGDRGESCRRTICGDFLATSTARNRCEGKECTITSMSVNCSCNEFSRRN
jgi:hypothetical protein